MPVPTAESMSHDREFLIPWPENRMLRGPGQVVDSFPPRKQARHLGMANQEACVYVRVWLCRWQLQKQPGGLPGAFLRSGRG